MSILPDVWDSVSEGENNIYDIWEAYKRRHPNGYIQYPNASNGYTTIIDFNDNNYGGNATYEALLTFTIQ
jgi:hypothetical protein